MNVIKLLKKALKTPGRVPMNIIYRIPFLSKIIPDEPYLKFIYFCCFGKRLNLDNPKTFSEKLQWLKLYDRRPEYTTMVDKYEVKKLVAGLVGEDYIIPTIGVWDSFDDIDFDALPSQFVMKCTHDSGGLFICKDKATFDKKAVKRKITTCLKRNFYYMGREWPYKDVKPRIIIEKYMIDESGCELSDYKLMCFNGKVKCTYVCSNRNSDKGLNINFYDDLWRPLNVEWSIHPRNPKEIDKPFCYDEMVYIAERLSKDIPFVRIDFYQCNNKVYFGEMTFFPTSGFLSFKPQEFDETFGDMIKLKTDVEK